MSYALCITQAQNARHVTITLPMAHSGLDRGGYNRGSGGVAPSRQRIFTVFT